MEMDMEHQWIEDVLRDIAKFATCNGLTSLQAEVSRLLENPTLLRARPARQHSNLVDFASFRRMRLGA
jgi:hypothetical protein